MSEVVSAPEVADIPASPPAFHYWLAHYIVAVQVQGVASTVNGNTYIRMDGPAIPMAALGAMAGNIAQQTTADLIKDRTDVTEADVQIEDVVFGAVSSLGYMSEAMFNAGLQPAEPTVH